MDMNLKIRPVWAEIDLDALAHNMREARRLTRPSAFVMSVVKADAYGHGAVKTAQTFLNNGADRLGVAVLEEAVELRKAGYIIPILVLGYTYPEQYSDVIANNIEQTIFTYETAEALSLEAAKYKKKVNVHIKIDTGMRRIGFEPSLETIDTIKKISELPAINVVGIFSHFAQADSDKSFTEEQYRKFMWVCDMLGEANLSIPLKHIANSAAIIDLPGMHMDMVRAGIMQYCLSASDNYQRRIDIKQAMTLKARISNIKTISAGESVGYGRTFIAEKPITVATLPIGYADGYSRELSGKAFVLVHGQRVPIIGRICMDQCMVDVTSIPDAKIGDEAVLFGTQGNSCITINELAQIIGTIDHEIVCGISKRVPRIYIENGAIVSF